MGRSKRFEAALQFAARLHAEQRRKGSETPYIAHLLAVTAIAIEHSASEDEAIAALLHDAAEDQGGKPTLRLIRRRFGKRVARIVKGCTDTFETPKPAWRPRKETYITHVEHAPRAVRLVAAADKLHNVRSILADYRVVGDAIWDNFTTGREGTLWFYRAMATALRAAAQPDEPRLNGLVGELEEAVAELERVARAEVGPEGCPGAGSPAGT